ncbi:MAG TPA: recombinase family protein [Gemmataceae bacterium]|jgi:site-specific DNA recombinase
MNKNTKKPAGTLPLVRCAVYTRKSTEEGLEQEFNSLDAQREAGESFVASQRAEGWTCLPDRYDDGGFTGGNMDRPALRRLLVDIEAGKIDCVVVYKVDRLSRSLLDFARMMQVFDNQRVSFVSVTQQFNTATSMGRLILNVLLSFAQFEREIISERTRDKMAATRRKGKWSGGLPVLGYDIDPQGYRLVLNEAEAVQVRAIFQLYLEEEALLPVLQELEKRGWTNKRWTTRAGKQCGGQPFSKSSLHRLLTNPIYAGKTRYKDEVHDGEHTAIIDAETFQRVQAVLLRNGRTGGAPVRNQFGAVLKGLLRCRPCGCSMTPSHTTKGDRRYRYYTCVNAQKRGWDTCPSKSIPAAEIEAVVLKQIRCIGCDPGLLHETLAQAQKQEDARLIELDAERRVLERDLARWHADLQSLSGQLGRDGDRSVVSRLADLQERIDMAERRLTGVREQVQEVRLQRINEEEARDALAAFDPVWQVLTPLEQTRLVGLLVEQVHYDGATGKVAITFHPTSIRALADELAQKQQEMSA